MLLNTSVLGFGNNAWNYTGKEKNKMKNRRCYCGRPLHANNQKAVKIRQSDGTCDVYGCPSNATGFNNGWMFYTAPHSPSTKHKNHSQKTEIHTSTIKYFFDSLANSSINGISNCTSSSSIFGKLIWLMVFCMCVIGFSYQASHFYRLYRSKPSVVQIEVEDDGLVEFPAVTVCNTNRVRRSAFCDYFPERCQTRKEMLSEYEINEIMYDLLINNKENVKMDLGHTRTMFTGCDFIGTPIVQGQECLDIWENFYDPDYGNCYIFTSKTKDNIPLQARKVDFWQEANDLTLVMDVEPEEFMERRRTPGLILVVHDERSLPDIHTEGLFLTAGLSYTITVSKSTVVLLPPPYKTNCTDYLNLPWHNLHPRRLTSRVCTVGCSQDFQLKKCNFVTKNLSLFYESLPYHKEDDNDENLQCALEEERRTVDYCRSICGLPCSDTAYTVSASDARLTENELSPEQLNREGHHNMSIYDDTIHVRIFFSTMEHKIFRHIPKYDTMELFSFLGGYSGVWLGFSLLTVYEMIEILISTIMFSIRTRIKQRKHQKFVQTIMNSQRNTRTSVKTYKKKKHYG